MPEHTRAASGRCSCGAEIVPYESGESTGCAVAGRPYIYARFMDNNVLAAGELFPDDDDDEIVLPDWTKDRPFRPLA